jgi:hypothetical protein
MGLWIVDLEANDKQDDRVAQLQAAVIADTARSAKVKATRYVGNLTFLYDSVHSTGARELDVYSTGVILVAEER